jgi:hypothetical protein
VILAEIAEELVRAVLADQPDEKTILLLAISVSHLEEHWDVQLELPLGLKDEARRPGTKKGMARWVADCAVVDRIRDRFGWDAVGYASVALGISRPFPTSFASSPKRTCDHHRPRGKNPLMGCLWSRSWPIPHFTDPPYHLRAVSRAAQFSKAVRADTRCERRLGQAEHRMSEKPAG